MSQTTMKPKKCAETSDDDDAGSQATSRSSSFINKPLIPLKIILFCWYAAGACLLPYMTLHMKQLGLTMVEMTAVYAILPIIQMLGTPLAGFMADRTGNYKSVLMTTLMTCVVTTLMIQFFVPARKPRDPNAPTLTPTNEHVQANDPAADTLYMLTFWLYLCIRVFHQVAVGLTYVLLDTTTLVLAGQNNSNYGRQRFWAILATGVFSPICGFVIDRISYQVDEYGQKINNYDPAFYFFNALTLMTLATCCLIKVEIAALPRNVWSNVRPLVKAPNVWIFLFAVFIMGSCWGFLESFLFIHLQKLDAPNYLLGLTVTVGALIGLPFLYCSEWFVKKFGAVQLLVLALAVYFVRLVGYSMLDNPWWCIPYELMEAFTLHLMWVSTVTLAFEIAPKGMLATMQAIVGGLNFGVGRGFGSLVGGAVIVLYDTRTAFRVVGTMALVTALVWALLNNFVLPPLHVHANQDKSYIVGAKRRQSAKDIEASSSDTTTAAAS